MKRTEVLCAIVLLAAVPGAALAGTTSQPSPLPKPRVSPIKVPTGAQVAGAGIVRPAGSGGASFTPKH